MLRKVTAECCQRIGDSCLEDCVEWIGGETVFLRH